MEEDFVPLDKEAERLMRNERDEVYEWHSDAHDQCYQEAEIVGDQEAKANKLRSELSEATAASSSMSSPTRVSRKEESKVVVPPGPRVNDLGLWKASLIQAIIVAASDPDHQPWIDWTKEAIDDPEQVEKLPRSNYDFARLMQSSEWLCAK